MKHFWLKFAITGVVIVIAFLLMFYGYDYYRSRFMECHNMPDGQYRCYNSAADWIYDLADGEMTVAPENISDNIAILTYNAWAINKNLATRSYFATLGTTVTPVPPSPFADGSTPDPTKIQAAVETLQYYTIQTFNAPPPTNQGTAP